MTEEGLYSDLVRPLFLLPSSFLFPLKPSFSFLLLLLHLNQATRENSRFRTLMAAQLALRAAQPDASPLQSSDVAEKNDITAEQEQDAKSEEMEALAEEEAMKDALLRPEEKERLLSNKQEREGRGERERERERERKKDGGGEESKASL